jgi:hypothetical protein
MTKLKPPMATDRISTELTKAASVLFPLAFQEPTRRGAEQVAMFTEAAEDILRIIDDAVSDAVIDQALQAAKKYTDVDVDSLRNEKKALRKEHVINQLLVACLACQRHTSATYEVTERLRNDIKKTRALIARNKRDADSKKIDALVKHHAHRRWRENRKRRGSDIATARDIMPGVNEDLKASGLWVGIEAIRKRIRAFK